ncbi:MAG TPA: PqqD family protein [Acidimicrobiales bacterium]|jgi:hypothetical protein
MTQFPRSRTAHIRTSRGEHGALIAYDVGHDVGHVLNATAAAVYELADGTRSAADIAVLLEGRTGLPVDEDVVGLAVRELAEANLLEAVQPVASSGGITRRDLMRRLALSATAAAVLPSLGSIANLSQVISPAPRLVGSSSQAGPGYHRQPFLEGPYPYRPAANRPASPRPASRADVEAGATPLL